MFVALVVPIARYLFRSELLRWLLVETLELPVVSFAEDSELKPVVQSVVRSSQNDQGRSPRPPVGPVPFAERYFQRDILFGGRGAAVAHEYVIVDVRLSCEVVIGANLHQLLGSRVFLGHFVRATYPKTTMSTAVNIVLVSKSVLSFSSVHL